MQHVTFSAVYKASSEIKKGNTLLFTFLEFITKIIELNLKSKIINLSDKGL